MRSFLKTNPLQDRKSKYGNLKTEYGGYVYMSKKEANYAMELDFRRKASKESERVISFERQVPFILQESFTDSTGVKHQKITYICDFVVTYGDGKVEVIDVKPSKDFQTNIYKLKKKMLLYKHRNIIFKEVY